MHVLSCTLAAAVPSKRQPPMAVTASHHSHLLCHLSYLTNTERERADAYLQVGHDCPLLTSQIRQQGHIKGHCATAQLDAGPPQDACKC